MREDQEEKREIKGERKNVYENEMKNVSSQSYHLSQSAHAVILHLLKS